MPDLDFKITNVAPASRGMTPLLQFQVDLENQPPTESIHSVMLQAQIQIQCPRRGYTSDEKEKLVELFGAPAQWGQTLRNRLWTITSTIVSPFTGRTTAQLVVPCTFDLNVAATKFFHALDGGDIPLLFLFSGTVFYAAADGRLQVQQISWNKEATYQMPTRVWREMMDEHYPNSAWLALDRDVFDQLNAYKRAQGLATWEQTVQRLLAQAAEREEVLA